MIMSVLYRLAAVVAVILMFPCVSGAQYRSGGGYSDLYDSETGNFSAPSTTFMNGYRRQMVNAGLNVSYRGDAHLLSFATGYQFLDDLMQMDQDYLPDEQRLRDYVQGRILATYRASGFQRISTPMLEDMENLDKSEGGDNLNLIFKVLKRGDKLAAALASGQEKDLSDMGLRYDLTLPLSRYYAANKDKLPTPFKVIQTDRVFRAERPQKGRMREFVQCDIDILGDGSTNAEIELIDVTARALLDIGVYALSLARSFLESCPDRVKSQRKQAPTGVDEQAGILLMNPQGQMAGITLSLHSKQPKRAVISCEKGYLEISDYPRADSAIFVDALNGTRTRIEAGKTADALVYEMQDMEEAVRSGDASGMKLSLTADVMALMTGMREEWGFFYPEEEEKGLSKPGREAYNNFGKS